MLLGQGEQEEYAASTGSPCMTKELPLAASQLCLVFTHIPTAQLQPQTTSTSRLMPTFVLRAKIILYVINSSSMFASRATMSYAIS